MTYVEPTAASFKQRFPGFASVSDAIVQSVLAEAIPQVGETWIERDRVPAILYLTAHMLIMEGQPAASAADAMNTVTRGPVKRVKVGDVETEFTGGSSGAGGGSGIAASLSSSEYGRRYLELMRRNFPAVVAV